MSKTTDNIIQDSTVALDDAKQFSNTKIAIIGYGRFGKLWAELWARVVDSVLVYDNNAERYNASTITAIQFIEITELALADVVFYCVPISALQQSLYETAAHLSPHSLVCDICSVKELPVEWMQTILPPKQAIVGTHPLFGPDSVKIPSPTNSLLTGNRENNPSTANTYSTEHDGESKNSAIKNDIVVNKVRVAEIKFDEFVHMLQVLGLKVHKMSAKEHDAQAAYSQGLTHLVGRVLNKLSLPKSVVSTQGYKSLLEIISQTCNDSEQLFYDLQNYNKESAKMWLVFSEALDLTINQIITNQTERESAKKNRYIGNNTISKLKG